MKDRLARSHAVKHLVLASVAACLLALASTPAMADCGDPPKGFGPSWWREYAKWCKCMGGTPNADTVSCTGVRSGGGGGSGPQCDAGEILTSTGGCMPADAMDCGNGTHCPAGTRCGSGGTCLRPGDVDCGSGHSCPAGASCLPGGRCLPKGGVDCGTYTCPAGAFCGSKGSCLPSGTVDCGDGRSCPAGTRCGSANKCFKPGTADCGGGRWCDAGQVCRKDGGCMPEGGIDCGTFGCPAGSRCGSGNRCLAPGQVDCGNGRSCRAGTVCAPSGGCMPEGATECGDGRSCRAGTYCGQGNRCIEDGRVDCGTHSCPSGQVCGTSGGCRPADAMPCGGGYCRPGWKCGNPTGGQQECVNTAYRPETAPPRAPLDQRISEMEAIQLAITDITKLRGYQKDLTAAVKILGMPWVVDVPFADEMQRAVVVERTKNRLRDLETKILTAVIIRMRADVRNIVPFQWETPQSAAEKERVVEETARELAALQAQAASELAAPSTFQERPYTPSSGPSNLYQRWTTGFSTTIDFKPGPNLRRLEEIRRTGQFWE